MRFIDPQLAADLVASWAPAAAEELLEAAGVVRADVDFAQLRPGSCRCPDMDLDLTPAPGRYPFRLSARWVVVALIPVDGELVLGFFYDGELVRVQDDPPALA